MNRRLASIFVSAALSACATTSPRPESASTTPIWAESESIEVETSTDAEFVLELPLDDDPEVTASLEIEPILAVTGTVARYDLPVRDHERVDFWVEYLRSRGRRHFTKWLARSTRYVPLFWSVLDHYGLPRDLVFLAMVESGFSTSAYSWAHAAGPWQFVQSTGRRYGLRIDFWVDERRDFEKATDAAARHLRDLYEQYDDWFLAMAAYNAGPGKVNRAIRRYGTDDFWTISERRYLRRETKQYVPKILAAARLSKLPHVYGLEKVAYQPPLAWTTITATRATSLRAVASACSEVDERELRALNPALRCGVTPPGEIWEIRVPQAVTATCAAELARVAEPFVYRYHAVASTDSAESIARAHQTTPEALLEFNRIASDQILDFEEIVVPVPQAAAGAVPILKPPHLAFRPPGYGPQSLKLVRYRVRSGDSLWRIAQRFHVSISDLTKWNGLRRSSTLRIGDRLRIYLGGRAARAVAAQTAAPRRSPGPAPVPRPKVAASDRRHVVRPGESPWIIATAYGIDVGSLLSANGLRAGEVIQPGQTLVLPVGADATRASGPARAAPPSSAPARTSPAPAVAAGRLHVVRAGESWWSIANAWGTTVRALAEANGQTRQDVLQPGQTLVLPAGGDAPRTSAPIRAAPPSSAPTPSPPSPAVAAGRHHVVRAGESWWSIANAWGTTVRALAEANGQIPQDVLQPGQTLRVPASKTPTQVASPRSVGSDHHLVEPGESLWSIATQHGLTVAQLCALNGLRSDAVLQPGDALRIASRR